MSAEIESPRAAEEWRVEVVLEDDDNGQSLGESLHRLQLDDEARKRLGGSVIVSRDGNRLFLYAWHEDSAREAERVVRELMEEDNLSGEVRLVRWHPAADEWRPADQPLPEGERELDAEEEEHARAGKRAGSTCWSAPTPRTPRSSSDSGWRARLRRERGSGSERIPRTSLTRSSSCSAPGSRA